VRRGLSLFVLAGAPLSLTVPTLTGCGEKPVALSEEDPGKPEFNRSASPRGSFAVVDIAKQDYSGLGQFDLIYSLAVWEHIKRPDSALRAVKHLLAPGGTFYLYANLYRGPLASHLYRDVYFPWPHLLFRDDVFVQCYEHIGRKSQRPAWVNKLTAAQCLLYFHLAGFTTKQVWYATTALDEQFYTRFEDVLGKYPKFDLERGFIHAHLVHQESGHATAEIDHLDFVPVSVNSPANRYTSAWNYRASSVAVTNERDGFRCDIAGSSDTSGGQYGGVTSPVTVPQAVRLEVTFLKPQNIQILYLDGSSAAALQRRPLRPDIRWEWHVTKRAPLPVGRTAIRLAPGQPSGHFRLTEAGDASQIVQTDFFVRIAPGSRAGFILHKIEIASEH